MLETTKTEDGSTIGKFGMGFKSVFKYTCEPEIYSDDEAFRIINYLLPVSIESSWNYIKEMTEELSYSLNGAIYTPFIPVFLIRSMVNPTTPITPSSTAIRCTSMCFPVA